MGGGSMTISEILDLCRAGESKRQFAFRLHSTPATITRVYQGKLGLSSKLVAALLVKYPQHKDEIIATFMQRGETL
jgi:hypothetical protein